MDIIAFCSRNCLHYFFRFKKNTIYRSIIIHVTLRCILFYTFTCLFYLLQRISHLSGGFFCGLFLCVFNPTHHFNSKIGRGLEYVHMYLVTLLTDNLRIPSMFFFMSVRNLHIMSNYYNYKHFVY